MATFEIPENPVYTENIRKFEAQDPGHADLFNPVVQSLVNNDAFLKSMADKHDRKLAWFGVCGSQPKEVKKTVDLDGFQLYDGARVVVYFSYGNTADEMTLEINGTGAAPVHYNGKSVPAGYIQQAGAVELVYYWNYWRVVGELTQAQMDALASRLNSLKPSDIGALSASGNAVSASKWNTVRKINGLGIDGTADRTNYGTCSTAGSTVAKTVSCTGFYLVTGAEITVKFSNTNTASNPTLNVNSTGAKAIYYKGAAIPSGYLLASGTYTFRYDGTWWNIVGDMTQKQLEILETKVSSLQAENRRLKEEVSNLNDIVSFLCDEVGVSLEEKIGVDYDNGRLWEYRGQDTIVEITTSINGAKCTDVPIQGGAKYKVITNMSSDCTNPVCVMEVFRGAVSGYSVAAQPLGGKEGMNTFEFITKENSTNLLINCSGSNSEIKVYKLKY